MDSKDLRAAAQKDMDALKPRLKQGGFSDSEIQAAFDKVHAQNVASGLYK